MEYETYKSQGYYSPLRVLTENETEHFRKKVEGIRDRQDADGKKYLGANVHYLFPDLYDLVGKAEILDQVEKVLGPDILCWNAAFFNKEARDPNYVSWHQDLTYWGLEPPAIVTAWIALTPSTTENGCMRVVPGSHADGQIDHADFHGDNNLLSRGQEIQVEVKDEDAGDWVLSCPREFEASIYMQAMSLNLWPAYEELGGPVKLIACDPEAKGAPGPAYANRALAEDGAYVYECIPNTGHLLQIQQPELCHQAMFSFLAEKGIG